MLKWGLAIRAAGIGIAIYAGSGATQVNAADMPLFGGDEVAPQTKVEFGTGWYIRGDVAWARDKGPVLTQDLSYLSDEVRNNWSADLGAGYKFNNWFRGDLTLGAYGPQSAHGAGATVNCPTEIRGLYSTSPTTGATTNVGVWAVPSGCTPNQQADLRKYLLLNNAYIDLGTWYGVTPYVGAGAGVARIDQEGSVIYTNNSDGSPYNATLTVPAGYPAVFYSTPNAAGQQSILNPQPVYNYGTQNWNRTYHTVKYNFAWALMAGLGYNLTDNATIELGYRYVNFGSYTGINSYTGGTFSKNLSTQEIRLGVRYLVD